MMSIPFGELYKKKEMRFICTEEFKVDGATKHYYDINRSKIGKPYSETCSTTVKID